MNRYLAYGSAWIGIVFGSLIYSLLAEVFGIVFLYAATLTLFHVMGIVAVFLLVIVLPIVAGGMT